MRLEIWKVKVLIKWLAGSYVQSQAVLCNMLKDIKRESYPDLFKNINKIKCSQIIFLGCLLVLFFSLLFEKFSDLGGLGELDS